MGKEFGKEAWARVRALWEGLRPRIEARPAAKGAAEDIANEQVARLLEQRSGASIEIRASGERSVAAYNVSNSTISTGDKH